MGRRLFSLQAAHRDLHRTHHSARHQLESHCQRAGKPCLIYAGDGVSGFAVAMAQVSRGEFSLTDAD